MSEIKSILDQLNDNRDDIEQIVVVTLDKYGAANVKWDYKDLRSFTLMSCVIQSLMSQKLEDLYRTVDSPKSRTVVVPENDD